VNPSPPATLRLVWVPVGLNRGGTVAKQDDIATMELSAL